MTKVEFFNRVKAMTTDAEMIAHADKEIALLANRSSKPTKVQIENEALKQRILAVLASSESPMTVSEIMEATGIASNQKATSMLTQLRGTNEVERSYDKKKAYFSIAVAE